MKPQPSLTDPMRYLLRQMRAGKRLRRSYGQGHCWLSPALHAKRPAQDPRERVAWTTVMALHRRGLIVEIESYPYIHYALTETGFALAQARERKLAK